MSAEEPVPSGVTPSEVPTIGITSSVVDEAVTAVALPPSADGESGENSDSVRLLRTLYPASMTIRKFWWNVFATAFFPGGVAPERIVNFLAMVKHPGLL